MRYCVICDNLLEESTATGNLSFRCPVCQVPADTKPEDSLMHQRFIISTDSDLKYTSFIKQSSTDPTIGNVNKQCTKCGRKWMKRIRVGDNETVLDICECQNIQSSET
jgi:DNA-directed RNA polymerase subunit M/transcription elongation factor TFIIS